MFLMVSGGRDTREEYICNYNGDDCSTLPEFFLGLGKNNSCEGDYAAEIMTPACAVSLLTSNEAFNEAVQDAVNGFIEDYVYDDANNQWVLNVAAHFDTSNNFVTVTGDGTATSPFIIAPGPDFCNQVITCVEGASSLDLQDVTTNNLTTTNLTAENATIENLTVTTTVDLPDGVDLFTINGTQVQSGEDITMTRVNDQLNLLIDGVVAASQDLTDFSGSWDPSNPIYTYVLNGQSLPVDYSVLNGYSQFIANDDQVLIADPSSPFAFSFVPTVVTDPDGDDTKTNYTVSGTIKSTYICNGQAINTTNNKVITSGTFTTNTTAPATILPQLDPTTTPYMEALKVNVGCNEDVYVPVIVPEPRRTIDISAHNGEVYSATATSSNNAKETGWVRDTVVTIPAPPYAPIVGTQRQLEIRRKSVTAGDDIINNISVKSFVGVSTSLTKIGGTSVSDNIPLQTYMSTEHNVFAVFNDDNANGGTMTIRTRVGVNKGLTPSMQTIVSTANLFTYRYLLVRA